jgi:heptosyltransferase-2
MGTDFDKVDRILVRAVNWVGDTILTYPAVQRLKTRFPKAHLAIFVRDHLADLWKTFPYVDEVIAFQQKRGWDGFSEDLRLGFSLAKKKFDVAVIFPRSFRSAYQLYLARIPIRLGYRDEWRSLFLTHGVPRTEDLLRVHRIHYYQRLIDALGLDERLEAPRIYLRDEDRNWARERLNKLGLLDGRPLIGMNPGATYGLAKCWYPDRFGELARRLEQKWKASVLLFGRPDEGLMTQEILKHLGEGGIDLTGKTDLLQLAAVLEHCRLLITNDTGTMHVAAAVGTPVVAIFGPTDPKTTGPWGEGHAIVKKEVDCSPCLKRVCPTDHACMKKVTVDEVEALIDHRLGSVTK